MTSTNHPTLRLSGPVDLITGIPQLLGFHPHDSLVLVGLTHGALAVTARIDLTDSTEDTIADTVAAMRRGGSNQFIAALWITGKPLAMPSTTTTLRRTVARQVERHGGQLLDCLLVQDGNWWSLLCDDPTCCPTDGRPLPDAPTAFQAAATVEGLVALPSRDHLHERFRPDPDREQLRPLVERCAAALTPIVINDALSLQGRIAVRAIRRGLNLATSPVVYEELADVDIAGIGAALRHVTVRDAIWADIDQDQRGDALWLDCARRLPEPYNAAPLFLYGWTAWRRGDGALASIAANYALAADPEYSAARLLLDALFIGVDPRAVPFLSHDGRADLFLPEM